VEDRNQLRAKGIDPDVTIDDLVGSSEVEEEEHKSDAALQSSDNKDTASTNMLHKHVLKRREDALIEQTQSQV